MIFIDIWKTFLTCPYNDNVQAIQLDPRHGLSFRLKGQLQMTKAKPEQAVIAFFQSASIEKEIGTLKGIFILHSMI